MLGVDIANRGLCPEQNDKRWPAARGSNRDQSRGVVFADNTLIGAGVVLAQRLEQLAAAGGVVAQGSVSETVGNPPETQLCYCFTFAGRLLDLQTGRSTIGPCSGCSKD